MKWVIRIVGFLVTAAVFTGLRYSGIYLSVGSVGTGLITAVVFYCGVYFIPGRIIRRMEAKRAEVPSVPDVLASDAPEECAPEMKQRPPDDDVSATPSSPPEEVKARRIPRLPHNSGYIFVIICLTLLLLVSFFTQSPAEKALEKEYRTAINELEAAADAAYSKGLSDAADAVDYYDCFSSGFLAGSRSSGGLVDWNDCAGSYSVWLSGQERQPFSEWSDAKKALEAIQEKYGN